MRKIKDLVHKMTWIRGINFAKCTFYFVSWHHMNNHTILANIISCPNLGINSQPWHILRWMEFYQIFWQHYVIQTLFWIWFLSINYPAHLLCKLTNFIMWHIWKIQMLHHVFWHEQRKCNFKFNIWSSHNYGKLLKNKSIQ